MLWLISGKAEVPKEDGLHRTPVRLSAASLCGGVATAPLYARPLCGSVRPLCAPSVQVLCGKPVSPHRGGTGGHDFRGEPYEMRRRLRQPQAPHCGWAQVRWKGQPRSSKEGHANMRRPPHIEPGIPRGCPGPAPRAGLATCRMPATLRANRQARPRGDPILRPRWQQQARLPSDKRRLLAGPSPRDGRRKRDRRGPAGNPAGEPAPPVAPASVLPTAGAAAAAVAERPRALAARLALSWLADIRLTTLRFVASRAWLAGGGGGGCWQGAEAAS